MNTDQLEYAQDATDYWVNSMWPASNPLCLAVGGIETAGGTRPLVLAFVVTSSGELQKRGQLIVNDLPDARFAYMAASSATNAYGAAGSGLYHYDGRSWSLHTPSGPAHYTSRIRTSERRRERNHDAVRRPCMVQHALRADGNTVGRVGHEL